MQITYGQDISFERWSFVFANFLKKYKLHDYLFAVAQFNITLSHYPASVKDFRLEAFCRAFVFHCLASQSLLHMLGNDGLPLYKTDLTVIAIQNNF